MEKKEQNKLDEYKRYVRPRVVANSIRMDDELYRLNEIIRVYNSNEFVSPSNIDILRILLQQYVAQLREKDPWTILEIEKAIKLVSNHTEKDK